MSEGTEQKTIEVELRGHLTAKQYNDLLHFFTQYATFVTKKERILIDYSVFLPDEGIRERQRDIRLRVTNGIPEIIVKLGSWGGDENRKELSVLAKKGEFDTLVQIFAALGFSKGIMAIRRSQVFQYKGIEFALVEVPNHSYYFEAEKMVGESDDKAKVHREIEQVVQELHLTPFTKENFYRYIELLNEEANELFDFTDYTDGYFRKRFSL
jgi:predicted adenylyl cyclase CyaB